MRWWVPLLALFLGLVPPQAAVAQETDRLEILRRAVFLDLFRDPANPALMRRYAQLSIRSQNYEAAIGTLERLLDLQPNNAAARFELAQAYFALGAYALTNYHLDILEASDGLSDADRAQLDAYRGRAERRLSRNSFSGRVTAGGAFTESDFSGAALGSAQLTWTLDLGGAHATQWITEGFLSTREAGGDDYFRFARLRTGPEFRLTSTSFGPRVQPFVQVTALRDGDGTDVNEIAGGLAYQQPFTEDFTGFAEIYGGAADLPDDGSTLRFNDATVGVAWAAAPQGLIRFSLNRRQENGDTEDTTLFEGRMGIVYRIDAPVQTTTRDWTLSGNFAVAQVDVEGGTNERTDDIYRIGFAMRGYLTDAAYVEGAVSTRSRNSTLESFDSSDRVFSLVFGWEY